MATAIYPHANKPVVRRHDLDIVDRHGLGFALLLATTATLFVRPADLVPAFKDWPIYQVLILGCAALSVRACSRQLSNVSLVNRPDTVSLLVLLVAVGVSHLAHGFIWAARASMFEAGKLIVLYVLISALVNTPRRLAFFIKWLAIAISFMATLALLDNFSILSIAAFEAIEDRGIINDGATGPVERIRGTGIFQDPNDFGLILVTGLALCSSFLTKPGLGILRYLWLVPIGVLISALALTHSRGALLSLLCAISMALCYFHGKKAIFLIAPIVPIMALVFSHRMADYNAINHGTGQERIQIWSDSLNVWRQYPLFGLGEGLIVDEIGIVTHNSFLHCYAELGFFGGTAFLACFLVVGLNLWSGRRIESQSNKVSAEASREVKEHRRICGFVFAALMGCTASMLTISRQFVAPTYLILGLASAANTLPLESALLDRARHLKLNNRFVVLSTITSIGALLTFYVVVRLFVRW
ncbi:O-antigen ligase family protein [Stieleria sp. JC731]|uniref:O-antigen ligase family protein n=1 Tax=Pirellulaceae TaxID=2691357 RepID=UPI001E5A5CBB|nr:O-antigen ligase family protein [Stieleria sp. JC731]MCC9599508.1 O-antigen ligase family protein [Stieleria sp. JC731]